MRPIYIIGGDMRNCYMAKYFAENGYDTYCIDPFDIRVTFDAGIKETANIKEICGVMVLPVPVSKDTFYISSRNSQILLSDIIEGIENCDMVCGGVIPDAVVKKCLEKNVTCYDFMKDNDVACMNSVATAEGAVFEAFMESDININQSSSLVTGYGRCAKTLARLLSCMGSDVTIAARSVAAQSQAVSDGYKVTDFEHMNETAGEFDFCFNTVPALVVKDDFLKNVSPSIVIIDIASKPGGVDFEFCRQHNIKFRHSLGIPGRYSPDTSGRILAEAIIGKGF